MRVNTQGLKGQGVKGKAIRAWLLSGKPLTQLEATTKFGYLRLGALIFQMRQEGIPITTENVPQEDGGAYARYRVDMRTMKERRDAQLSLFDQPTAAESEEK